MGMNFAPTTMEGVVQRRKSNKNIIQRDFDHLTNAHCFNNDVGAADFVKYQVGAQELIEDFSKSLNKFYAEWKELQTIESRLKKDDAKLTKESGSEKGHPATNDDVKKAIIDIDKQEVLIKKDKKSDAKQKLESMKELLKLRTKAVSTALKVLKKTFDEFMNAVDKNEDDISQEYRILKAQLTLFNKQYQALAGYVINNLPILAKIPCTICCVTAGVVLDITAISAELLVCGQVYKDQPSLAAMGYATTSAIPSRVSVKEGPISKRITRSSINRIQKKVEKLSRSKKVVKESSDFMTMVESYIEENGSISINEYNQIYKTIHGDHLFI